MPSAFRLSYQRVAVIFSVALSCAAWNAHAGSTLESIRQRGELRCGVNTNLSGFSAKNSVGNWAGLDVDVCRALAAAVLGSDQKVKYLPLSATQRLAALQNDEIDVLSRNTTFTLARDASLGLRTTVVTYYDGQSFMVPVKSKIVRASQLKGKTVCVQAGTTTEKNLSDFSRSRGLNIQILAFEKLEAATGNYFLGQCAALTADASSLASTRTTNAFNSAEHLILPDLISKEPLGPLVRRGDEEWFNAVRWVISSLVEAEELGITQANLEQVKAGGNATTRSRWLTSTGATGQAVGLNPGWSYRALLATGNYGEMFNRNLGEKSPLQLPRGLNNLWNQGGLQYAIPFF